MIATFNTVPDAEYTEVVSRCEDFLTEIDKETRAGKFTYAELEENEEDLTKLRGWLDKIRGRDTLDAARAQEAISAVQTCAEALDVFANRSTPPTPWD